MKILLFNEQFSDTLEHPHQILESTNINGGSKVKIKAILQTCNCINKNKRIYPKDILQEAVEKIKPLIKSHALTGELITCP